MAKTVTVVYPDRSMVDVDCPPGWFPRDSETVFMSASCYQTYKSANDFSNAPHVTPSNNLLVDDVPWFCVDFTDTENIEQEVSQVFAGVGLVDYKWRDGKAIAEISPIKGPGYEARLEWLKAAVRYQALDQSLAN